MSCWGIGEIWRVGFCRVNFNVRHCNVNIIHDVRCPRCKEAATCIVAHHASQFNGIVAMPARCGYPVDFFSTSVPDSDSLWHRIQLFFGDTSSHNIFERSGVYSRSKWKTPGLPGGRHTGALVARTAVASWHRAKKWRLELRVQVKCHSQAHSRINQYKMNGIPGNAVQATFSATTTHGHIHSLREALGS